MHLQVLYDIASGIGSAAKKDIATEMLPPQQLRALQGPGLPLWLLCCQSIQHI